MVDEEAPAAAIGKAASQDAAVGVRGAYEVDEHTLSPAACAERFGVSIDLKNIQGSRGLTKEQVGAQGLRAGGAACGGHQLVAGGSETLS